MCAVDRLIHREGEEDDDDDDGEKKGDGKGLVYLPTLTFNLRGPSAVLSAEALVMTVPLIAKGIEGIPVMISTYSHKNIRTYVSMTIHRKTIDRYLYLTTSDTSSVLMICRTCPSLTQR